MALDKADLEALLAPLRQKYLVQLKTLLPEIEMIHSHLMEGTCSPKDMEILKYTAHRLFGSGSTYGFVAITKSARALEIELLNSGEPRDLAQLSTAFQTFLEACKDALNSTARES